MILGKVVAHLVLFISVCEVDLPGSVAGEPVSHTAIMMALLMKLSKNTGRAVDPPMDSQRR